MAAPVISDILFDAPTVVRGGGAVRATIVSSDPDSGTLTVTAVLADGAGNPSASFNKSIPVEDPPKSGTLGGDDPTVTIVPVSVTEYDMVAALK